MNNRDKNKYEMLGNLVGYHEDHKSDFSERPAIAKVFGDLKMVYREIGLNLKVTEEGTKGKVASKDVSQSDLIEAALIFAGALYAYAAEIKDTELAVYTDVNTRSFLRKRDSEIPGYVESFFDKADLIADKLIPFGITEEKRVIARNKLEDYTQKFGAVASGRGSKKTAHATIKLLLDKLDERLKVLDKLMLGIKEEKAELYSRFEAAKTIYNKAGSHNGTEEKPAEPVPETKPA